jgi:hypothetical protein
MPTGRPRSAGTSKDSIARTKRIRSVAKIAGHTRGSVTLRRTWGTLAPLMTADSSSAGSIDRNAAVISRKAMGE